MRRDPGSPTFWAALTLTCLTCLVFIVAFDLPVLAPVAGFGLGFSAYALMRSLRAERDQP